MDKQELFIKAWDFAKLKHEEQLDKSGKDYFEHCKYVTFKVEDLCNSDFVFTKVVAILHDTCEDTETTYDELLTEFGQSVADHVNMLTRREDVSYMDYINSLKHNEVCRKVKIADLLHNMDLTRLNKITKEDIQRNRKYLKALEVLIEMEE